MLDLRVPMKVVAAQDGTLLDLHDETVVTVAGRDQPDFSFRYTVVEGSPGPAPISADGVLQPGEQGELRVEVRNRGPGVSQSTVVSLRSMSGARLHL